MINVSKTTFFSSFLVVLSLFILSACDANRGYTSRSGTLPGSVKTAEQKPETLDIEEISETELEDIAPAQINVEPVHVAILLPLSGKHEAIGQSMLQAAQLALFDIGDDNFKLMPRDTGGNAEGAQMAAQQAIQDGAQMILGPLFSDSVKAVKPVARGAGINVVAFSTDWTIAGDNTFLMSFLPFDQVTRLADYTMREQGLKNIAILTPKNDYGRIVTASWQGISVKRGYPRAKILEFSNTNEIDTLVQSVANYEYRKAQEQSGASAPAPFEAVLMPVGGQLARTISSTLNKYDLTSRTTKRLGTGLFDDNALATETTMDGAWFAAPSPDLRDAFEMRYYETYGTKPLRLSSLAYDATALAAVLAQRGFQNSGQADFSRTAILNRNGFSGIDGIFRFRSNGTSERGLAILEFKNKMIQVLDEAPKTFQ